MKNTQTTLPYGYEYIPHTSRILSTPLNDKCFVTLMTAMRLNKGGAPCGPAGNGKTESVKHLSTVIGQRCVVINCSDQMNHLGMANIFKGAVSSGSWICLDEFNRVCLGVLSSVASQLKDIFRAKSNGSSMMNFYGSDINVEPNFGVFITMNPGYAGRM